MNQYRTGGAQLVIPGHGVQVMQPMAGVEAVAGDAWYTAGGISAANAIGVYQPIGAASLAASYVNLANPGTYDAVPVIAPTFDAATGWTFANSAYLNSGVVPATGWSMIARFSAVAIPSGYVAGETAGGNTRFYLNPRDTVNTRLFGYSGFVQLITATTAGTMAIAGNACYMDGVTAAATTGTIVGARPIFIGALNASGTASTRFTGKLQAMAIYNAILDATQVAALHDAMMALA